MTAVHRTDVPTGNSGECVTDFRRHHPGTQTASRFRSTVPDTIRKAAAGVRKPDDGQNPPHKTNVEYSQSVPAPNTCCVPQAAITPTDRAPHRLTEYAGAADACQTTAVPHLIRSDRVNATVRTGYGDSTLRILDDGSAGAAIP